LDATEIDGEDSVLISTLMILFVPQEGKAIFWFHATLVSASTDRVRASQLSMCTNA